MSNQQNPSILRLSGLHSYEIKNNDIVGKSGSRNSPSQRFNFASEEGTIWNKIRDLSKTVT
jgi:hypothetical protein